jgi:hypothetical protein
MYNCVGIESFGLADFVYSRYEKYVYLLRWPSNNKYITLTEFELNNPSRWVVATPIYHATPVDFNNLTDEQRNFYTLMKLEN